MYHVLNQGVPGHAIVFFESQPTIPGAPGFGDVLEEAKDFASDMVTRLLRHADALVPAHRERGTNRGRVESGGHQKPESRNPKHETNPKVPMLKTAFLKKLDRPTDASLSAGW